MLTETQNLEDYIEHSSIGRHETFTPRYGWLKKGYDATLLDGNVFKAPDAIEKLGVGKNMVRSIRFWCQAFKIIQADRTGFVSVTEFGRCLLDREGWDPYLEDIASLWLLHWQLFIPKLEAVNWCFAFNRNHLFSFDSKNLAKTLINASKKYPHLANLAEGTFEKDASCILRMYADSSNDTESEIDCPFTQLEIIRRAEEKNQFCFDNSEKTSLPPLIYAAACFSYIANYAGSKQKAISLNRLTFDFNSPGVAFKLSETASGENLRLAAEIVTGFSLVEQTGGIQIHLEKEPMELFWQALATYYKEQ
ncbi:DUF4007 family protein [Syntrophomonas palmitatica]|uniref:DUF4007 family protein n=1 Tax=Syntrophomonas palmitatica TaxID=402877 RepID=UPI0006CF9FF9|nr:DUF4007 family protein [Syntrophomonas palmitatica]